MQSSKFLQKSGWWILATLSAVPLVLWLREPGLNFKFYDLPTGLRSLGDILGLCGMAMFSLVIILSSRLKFLEKVFKGLNEAYTAHHFFGGLCFCLLLFHPLLIAYDYLAVSFRATALFLLPSSNWAQNFGIFALFVMIIALVITFYTKLKYQVWKFTHQFLGLAFSFAFLHTFLIGFDIASNYWLRLYLFILGVLAFLSYCYRTLFSHYFVKTFKYTVKNIKSFPDKIWEIEFTPVAEEMQFNAGQFAFVKFYKSYLSREPHPFTMSSAPGFPLKLAIKELGDYTNKINSLRVGDLAVIEGPFGVFNFKNYGNQKQVWIAGGIGITPFLSMLRGLTYEDRDYKIDFYYSVKDEKCLAFQAEIEEMAKDHKNINIIFWNTAEKGFLTADKIKMTTPDLMERELLVCGPGIMMSTIKKQFLQKGVKKNRIHIEEFQLY